MHSQTHRETDRLQHVTHKCLSLHDSMLLGIGMVEAENQVFGWNNLNRGLTLEVLR